MSTSNLGRIGIFTMAMLAGPLQAAVDDGPHALKADPTFGTQGQVTQKLANSDLAYQAVQLKDGKFLLLAAQDANGSDATAVVQRFEKNGTSDTTFGTAGVVKLPQFRIGTNYAVFTFMALQSDGKIVLSGMRAIYRDGSFFQERILTRLTSEGALDTSFGDAGLVHLFETSYTALVDETALSIDAQDRILISGKFPVGGANVAAVDRLDKNGHVDTTFGHDGIVTFDALYPIGLAVARPSQDKILVTLRTQEAHDQVVNLVVRLKDSDGAIDPSFGEQGVVRIPFVHPPMSPYLALEPDAKGRVLVAEYCNVWDKLYRCFARIGTNGKLDQTFGDHGMLEFAASEDPRASAYIPLLVLQDDGNILEVTDLQDKSEVNGNFYTSIVLLDETGRLISTKVSAPVTRRVAINGILAQDSRSILMVGGLEVGNDAAGRLLWMGRYLL